MVSLEAPILPVSGLCFKTSCHFASLVVRDGFQHLKIMGKPYGKGTFCQKRSTQIGILRYHLAKVTGGGIRHFVGNVNHS